MSTKRSNLILATVCLALCAVNASAQELRLVLPTGASRGQHLKVTCYGRYLKDTQSVVWLRKGIEVEEIVATSDAAHPKDPQQNEPLGQRQTL